MKKFILVMASLSLLAGCGSYWIVNLSGETVTVNGDELTETCEKVSYSLWGLFGDWPVEIKVGDGEAKTFDDRKDYTVHSGDEIKEATKKELEQCDEKTPETPEPPETTEATPAQTATKAANEATAALNAKVEEYKAAETKYTEALLKGDNTPEGTTARQALSNEHEAAGKAATEAAQAAVAAAAAAKEAAGQEDVSEEDKAAAEAAAAAADKAVEDAKAANVNVG